ncbi:hypothetical protein BH09VER1_BH09VER1_15500 [soil metagenome]
MKSRLLILCLGILLGIRTLSGAVDDNAKIQSLVDSALVDFEAKRYDPALKSLLDAEKLAPDSAFILNLVGAAYTKKKDYAKAKSCFEKALGSDPNFFPAQFNIGELLFLQKQYPQALSHFVKMSSADPGNELLQFKLVLCLLLTDQVDDAQKLAKHMKFPGEGPAWYYAQAALQIKAGDKAKAREYRATAESIFPGKISLYAETFQDLGWPTN